MSSVVWTLKGIAGEFQGNSLYLSAPEITVGRTSKNNIVIDDHNISRVHITLFVQGREVLVRDEKSRNGTSVNDQKIEPGTKVKLAHGDRIFLGQHVFVIESEEKIDPTEIKKSQTAVTLLKKQTSTVVFDKAALQDRFKNFRMPAITWNRRTMMYAGLGLFVAIFLIMQFTVKKPNKTVGQKPDTITIQIDDPSIKKMGPMTDTELESLKMQAKAALQFQDYLAATQLYEKIVQADPRNEYNKTELEFAKNQLIKAIQQHLEFAKREYEKLNYERAIIEWKQVLALTFKANKDIYQQTVLKISDAEKEMQKKTIMMLNGNKEV